MKSLRAAAVQFEHAPGDKQANLETIRQFVARAAQQAVELIVFPECCISGYWHLRHLSHEQLTDLAEPVSAGPSSQQLLALARQHHMIVGAGLVEAGDDGQLYNTCVVAKPDGTCHRHRKLHCFVSAHMISGSEFTVFDAPGGWRLGVLICYDCNLNENVRLNALAGANLLLAPHQTGGCYSKSPHMMGVVDRALWDARHTDPAAIEAEFRGPKGRAWLTTWLPARAHDNGLFIIFSNGVGPDDDEVRTGNAMIIDPFGRIVVETWQADDVMIVADLDPALLEMNYGKMFIKTRRPDLYAPLAQPTGKEVDVRRTRFEDQGTAP